MSNGSSENEFDFALDSFRPEASAAASSSPDQRGRPEVSAPAVAHETSAERHDRPTPKRRRAWLTIWVVVALFVLAIPVAVGLTALAVAAPVGLVWAAYHGLVRFVIGTHDVVIGLDPGPRLMVFGLWLGLTYGAAVAIIRGWDMVVGRRGMAGTDSVAWAFTLSVGAVIVAIALTGGIIWWLLRLVVV